MPLRLFMHQICFLLLKFGNHAYPLGGLCLMFFSICICPISLLLVLANPCPIGRGKNIPLHTIHLFHKDCKYSCISKNHAATFLFQFFARVNAPPPPGRGTHPLTISLSDLNGMSATLNAPLCLCRSKCTCQSMQD